MDFTDWISEVFSSVPLFFLSALTLGVIFVNGWTDAPNAIASCVSTRVMTPRGAVLMASAFNFIGLIFSVLLQRSVVDTVYGMVDFGGREDLSRIALCAAMAAVVLWAVFAWRFGIPTSESHALIAGITGAAIALNGESGVRFSVWSRVLWGLVLSVCMGFFLGYFLLRILRFLFHGWRRSRVQRILGRVQILGGAANAFLHGAQDGQKFIGVLLLSFSASSGVEIPSEIPLWTVLLCCLVLSLGTSLGGGRIIRAVGMKMIRPGRDLGVASDLASAVSLAFCTAFGLPVSTTHVKTTAAMGAGASVRFRSVNWSVAGQMCLAWILTFPGCGLLGYATALLFFRIF